MTRRLLITLAVFAALAPAAQADRADDLLLEACRTGTVQGTYTQSEYRQALRRIPADSDQYTDCRDVLRRAQLAAARGGGGNDGGGAGGAGGGTGGGGAAIDPATGIRADALADATPEERAAVEALGKAGGAPLALASGTTIRPGDPGTLTRSDLPATLVALVVLLGLLATGSAAWTITNRVRDRRAAEPLA
jgi:hypothetical protein